MILQTWIIRQHIRQTDLEVTDLKKNYESPEFEVTRILFEQILEKRIKHSFDEDKEIGGNDELLD